MKICEEFQETSRIRNRNRCTGRLVVALAVVAMFASPALGQHSITSSPSAVSGNHSDQIRIVNLRQDSKRPPRRPRVIGTEGVVWPPDIDHGNKPGQATPVDFVLDGNEVVARYGVNGDANSGDSVFSHGGPIVVSNDVQLIFWGNWWKSASNPGTSDVVGMVQQVLASPFLSELSQYSFQNFNLRKPILVTSDPPGSFNSGDVDNLVWDLIDQGTFPEPDDGGRFVYIVFMPTTATSDSNARGAHGDATDYDFPVDVDHAWVGWVSGGDLAYITDVFTHELVESITDPEPDNAAWQMDRTINGGDEIGDACNNTADFLNGLFVQAYWSQKQRACVIPFGPPAHSEEAFWTGADGDVSSTWRDDNADGGKWHQQFGIALPNSARAGSPLVVISRKPSAEEVFWLGAEGDVSSTWRDDNADGGKWHQQFGIALPNSARAGSPLVVISRQPRLWEER